MFKKYKTLILVFVLVFAFSGVLAYLTRGIMSIKKASEKAINFINDNYYTREGLRAVLLGATREGEIYRLSLEVRDSLTEEVWATFNSYISRDGRFLFPDGIDLSKFLPVEEEVIAQSEVPKVELFVMSLCPYGNQAEETMLPVYNLLKDKVDWNIHYIVEVEGEEIYSLRGPTEVEQNQRELCILEHYGMDKWWEFASYVNNNCDEEGTCWSAGAKEIGLDTAKISTCVKEEGYTLSEEDAGVAWLAGAMGSPTLMINGGESRAVYQYGEPQVYLDAICSAFLEAPEECGTELEDLDTMFFGGSCS